MQLEKLSTMFFISEFVINVEDIKFAVFIKLVTIATLHQHWRSTITLNRKILVV